MPSNAQLAYIKDPEQWLGDANWNEFLLVFELPPNFVSTSVYSYSLSSPGLEWTKFKWSFISFPQLGTTDGFTIDDLCLDEE